MEKFIAARELLYTQKESSSKKKLVIRISAPCPVEKDAVDFRFHPGASVCEIEFDGLPKPIVEKVYGIDSIQALSLATDIDPYLKGLEKEYDLYWLSGEHYFEE